MKKTFIALVMIMIIAGGTVAAQSSATAPDQNSATSTTNPTAPTKPSAPNTPSVTSPTKPSAPNVPSATAPTKPSATAPNTPAATAPNTPTDADKVKDTVSVISPVIVAVFDLDKVMTDSPKAKLLQDKLDQEGQDLAARLEGDKASLTPEQYKQKQDATYAIYLVDKQDTQKQLDDLVNQALAQLAQEKQLTVILYKSSVAFGGIDITADVIQKLS